MVGHTDLNLNKYGSSEADVVNNGVELRHRIRNGEFKGQTAGQAPDFLQANIVILPKDFAGRFLQFSMNNPKSCPLIGISEIGNPKFPDLGTDIDIRTDVPKYNVFKDGELVESVDEINNLWRDDLVTFALGCSFTFEEALIAEGFSVRHIEQNSNVPMYNTSIPTIPANEFNGPLVVTMRPYKREQIADVYDICAKYPHAHGTPVHWGNPLDIGILDIRNPDYGDQVLLKENDIPVFWACGVTPQVAITHAKPPLCITHAPGHMLVTDLPSSVCPQVPISMNVYETI